MRRYNTAQRMELLGFFKENPDRQFSAEEIFESLENCKISKSAVYRNLSDLVSEGRIQRLAGKKSREILYRYTDAEECRNCIHLSCIKCKKTFHMDKEIAEELEKKIYGNENFTINKSQTVLYGVCSDCSDNKETKSGFSEEKCHR